MPWKNGGGETTEIAVFPEAAGLSEFDWRVSMARVDSEGPFSEFPGIDRTLSILEGAGIVLDVEGHEPIALTRQSPPHAFPADVPTTARLIDGSVVDFNVMTRRDRLAHRVASLSEAARSEAGSVRLILSAGGPLAIDVDGRSIMLDRFDALLLDPAEHARIGTSTAASAYLVTFRPV